MTCSEKMDFVSNLASILTFFGGAGAWCYYQNGFCKKRKALEKQLLKELEIAKKSGEQGAVGFLHLTAKTGLTESEILQASFGNCRIKRLEKLDAGGKFTEKILFQYNEGSSI